MQVYSEFSIQFCYSFMFKFTLTIKYKYSLQKLKITSLCFCHSIKFQLKNLCKGTRKTYIITIWMKGWKGWKQSWNMLKPKWRKILPTLLKFYNLDPVTWSLLWEFSLSPLLFFSQREVTILLFGRSWFLSVACFAGDGYVAAGPWEWCWSQFGFSMDDAENFGHRYAGCVIISSNIYQRSLISNPTYQVIPGHGNPQKRRTIFGGYLFKYCCAKCQTFHQVCEKASQGKD